jgi:DNA-binding LacI/PurR family transcriptional regulator
MRIVTVVDVAQRAGVSIATVSRVINNSRMVSEQKRTRILEVMRELGYRPVSRGSKNNRQILLLVSSITELIEDVAAGILEVEKTMDYAPALVISFAKQDTDSYQHAVKLLRILPQEMIYGIIFLNNMCNDGALWREFQQYPLVQIGESLDTDPLLVVASNDTMAMKEMTELLIRKGRKRFMLVSNHFGANGQQYKFCLHREMGFRLALEEAGLPFSRDMIIDTDYTPEGGMDVGRRIAEMKDRPDAVLCVSDYIASGCIAELQTQNIKVPSDIAVTGFDNREISEICRPALTTVRQSFEEMGAEALFLLNDLVSGRLKMGRTTYIQHSIIERGSA